MAARARPTLLLAIVAVASLALGCRPKDGDDPSGAGGDDEEISFADEASDTAASESDAQLLASSLVASSGPGTIGLATYELQPGDLQTRTIGDVPRAAYRPRGCLAVTPGDGRVVYQWTSCALGPNGLFAIDGTVEAHYRSTPDTLHLELTGTDLSVNLAKFDWTASAEITSKENKRTMTWKAQLSGTSAGGREFARSTEQTVSWMPGDACFELSGLSQGRIGKREIKTEIIDFRRCARSCPESGTIIVTNEKNGKRVELHYDGSAQATLIRPNGRPVKIPLRCRA